MSKRRKNDTPLWRRLGKLFSAKEGNLKIVTLCVIAATTFWFFSALNKSDYTTQINYPIVFSYQTDSTYLLSSLPESVTLQINGGGWNLLRNTLLVNTQPVVITLDAPTQVKRIAGTSLTDEIEAVLGGVRLDYIITDTLRINIDSVMEKLVRVVLDSTTIDLEENYWVTSRVSVTPTVVKLHGPSSVVSQAGDTLMVSLPDQNIDENYEATIPLSYINTMVQVIPKEANVKFNVAPFVSLNKRVPLTTLNFPEDSSVYLTQRQVNVNFWVRESLVDEDTLDSAQFRVVANFNNINSRDSTLTPIVSERPDFAKRISVRPNKLKVRYAP